MSPQDEASCSSRPYTKKDNARAVERTTKETLFEGFSVFGAAGGACKASTRPVFKERPGAVSVTMKELHQRVDRYRSVGLVCTVVADYLEVLHGVIRRLLSSIGLVASKEDQNFMFVKALDEIKGNAYTIECTTKEMLTTLLGGFYFSGAAGGADQSTTMPVLKDRPGVVCVTMRELHQRVDRYRSMHLNCTVVADYLELHHGVVRRLLFSIGSAVFARNVSAGGLFSPEWQLTCIGCGVRFADNQCTTPETKSDYFYGQLGYRSLKANLGSELRDR
ncbi:hypothetical protein MRX96_025230 [Rhipicephalus microplus]